MRYFYFLGLFVFFVAFGLIGLWLMQNNSPLDMVWLGYEIHTSVAFVAILTFAFSIVMVFGSYLFLWVISLPTRTVNKWNAKQMQTGLDLLTKGFIAYSAGDCQVAQRYTAKAAKKLGEQTLLSTILSAEIARQAGDAIAMKQHYTALLNHQETEYLGLKGLIYQAQKEKDYGTLVSLGEKARKLKPKDMWLNAVLLGGYKQQKRWFDAEGELDQLVKALKKQPALAETLPQDVHEEDFSRQKGLLLYQRAREANGKHEFKLAGGLILQSLKYLPDFTPAYLLAAQILPHAGGTRKLRKLIEESWHIHPHPDLAKAHALVLSNESSEKRLKEAERLLNIKPDNIESHKAVAVAAIAANDFSKARNHVKAALQLQETPSLCQLMAHLAKLESDYEQVDAWKNRASLANPESLWVCAACNHQTHHWDISCSSCAAWDSYSWQLPRTTMPLPEPEALLLVDVVGAKKAAKGIRAWKNPYGE